MVFKAADVKSNLVLSLGAALIWCQRRGDAVRRRRPLLPHSYVPCGDLQPRCQISLSSTAARHPLSRTHSRDDCLSMKPLENHSSDRVADRSPD